MQDRNAPAGEAGGSPTVGQSSVRVEAALLGRLVNLVGELVLTRNQLLERVRGSSDAALTSAASRLSSVTSELQREVMRTRLLRVGNVWAQYPRLVRELSAGCGKLVRLELAGQDTEVDRAVIEPLQDALTHVLRNSIDHGLELPDARAAAGKAPEGRLRMSAFREGSEVNIEVFDDGAGMSVDLIRRKAVERGLVAVDVAARMFPRDVLDLIFVPGFSTADAVTSLSGRGVGMDVVRTNIERVGGSIEVETREGEGTQVRIRIPLTLAILPAVLVTCRGGRYALPQASLLELVRVDANNVRGGFALVHDIPVYERRGSLMPLVTLAGELGLGGLPLAGVFEVAVVKAGDMVFGIVVDSIGDTVEVVVKPLTTKLADLGVYTGATILGDGQVALIVNVNGIAQRAGLLRVASAPFAASRPAATAAPPRLHRLLLAVGAARSSVAIPMEGVVRVDEIARRDVDIVGGREYVGVREGRLPLVRVATELAERRVHRDDGPRPLGCEVLPVVIFSSGGRLVGLVLEGVLDVSEEPLTARRPPARAGVLFSSVIAGRVTEVLDLEWFAARLDVEPTAKLEASFG